AQRMTGRLVDGLDSERVVELFAEEQLIHMLPSLDMSEQLNFRKVNRPGFLGDPFV
ncbi:hypothetical protein PSYMO_35552, partial [Pseudomonas amygdali pv. mori str. 301020]